jgi:hypothetical protein
VDSISVAGGTKGEQHPSIGSRNICQQSWRRVRGCRVFQGRATRSAQRVAQTNSYNRAIPRHTDSEIEQAAERFWQLADALDSATAQAERAGEVDGLIGPAAPSLLSPPAVPSGDDGSIPTDTMSVVARKETSNGKLERLSPEELAELRRPATAKSIEEKRAAVAQATQGLRVKVRVTPSMYDPPVPSASKSS